MYKVKIYCDIRKCVGCKSCEIACAVEHSKGKALEAAVNEKKLPKKRIYVESIYGQPFSVMCQHCEEAPCVRACISGAMYKDEETGQTQHDPKKCVGCWMCVMVCPFGVILRDIEEKNAVVCDLCPDREDYACVVACPTRALFAGTADQFKKKIKGKKIEAKVWNI